MKNLALEMQRPPLSSEWRSRIELAAAFRWFARLDMHESVANHLSLSISDDGTQFLINPRGLHFSRMRASSLLLLDAHDPKTMRSPYAPDPTAWYLHSRLHARVPAARCVMHLHSTYATALSCMEDSTMYPIDMNTARFHGAVVTDREFSGMALSDAEGDRVCGLVSEGKPVLLMANHGVLVIGESVAKAFDALYYFERAARTLMVCHAAGKPLRVLPDDVAAETALQWRNYEQLAVDHFENVKAMLDEQEPSYRT